MMLPLLRFSGDGKEHELRDGSVDSDYFEES
jgi:hypothetical protein